MVHSISLDEKPRKDGKLIQGEKKKTEEKKEVKKNDKKDRK